MRAGTPHIEQTQEHLVCPGVLIITVVVSEEPHVCRHSLQT